MTRQLGVISTLNLLFLICTYKVLKIWGLRGIL